MKNALVMVLLVLLLGGSATAGWKDLHGHPCDPLHQADKKAVVLFFVAADCAGSNTYAPEFNRICRQYAGRSIGFYVVHEDDTLPIPQAVQHARDYGYVCPVLLDPSHRLARSTGAKVTPEVAVVDAHARVLYHGQIDDRLLSCSDGRAPSSHDLCDALNAVLEGRPVAHASVRATGCAIDL